MTKRCAQFVSILLMLALILSGGPTWSQSSTNLVFDPGSGMWKRQEADQNSALSQLLNSEQGAQPREIVEFSERLRPGTILINTSERRLYHVLRNGTAMRYAIGVGREGFAWSGSERISHKQEWPAWVPPTEMRERERQQGNVLPPRMEGGPNNPLGARALYLGNTLYRIHGTNDPSSIGRSMSSGCIRMTNDDIVHLYEHVRVGARVIVRH